MKKKNRRINHTAKSACRFDFPSESGTGVLEQNLERARKHVEKYVWAGVLTYFIFLLVMVPTDYWIIDSQYFVQDFVRCMLGLINGSLALLAFYFFSCLPKIKRFFRKLPCC